MIEVRNALKAKKPTFIRHDAHKKTRIKAVWRRPKGRQNKMRLHRKGYARGISSGFGSPKAVYGLSKEGLQQVIVRSVSELISLDPKVDGVIVSRTTGLQTKQVIIAEASKKGFTLLNIDKASFEKKLSEVAAEKKKHKEKEAPQDSKESLAKVSDDENEKKLQEKKEKDKLLIKRE